MTLLAHFKALRRDGRGGFAVTFALSASVLVLMIGGGTDMARVAIARQQAQNITDQLVRQVVGLPASQIPSIGALTTLARARYATAFSADTIGPIGVSYGGDANSVTLYVAVYITVPTLFVRLAGLGSWTVKVAARANSSSSYYGSPARLVL